jgi:CDP-diacylglycerol pyrophosphatase
MKFLARSGNRALLFAAVILFAVSVPLSSYAGSRDVLWEILGTCLDPNVADYCSTCRSPLVDTPCAAGKPCKETTELWAKNDAYIAVRDRKMCGCPEDFVHGLVLPRARVTGVEDPRRPDGIWSFAWATARSRIADDSVTALAVNPKRMRAQDQLHVHILRLRKDARQRFTAARMARVQKLDEVWSAAGRLAATARLADYGVLVTSHPEGGFIVLIDWMNTEKLYAVDRCR